APATSRRPSVCLRRPCRTTWLTSGAPGSSRRRRGVAGCSTPATRPRSPSCPSSWLERFRNSRGGLHAVGTRLAERFGPVPLRGFLPPRVRRAAEAAVRLREVRRVEPRDPPRSAAGSLGGRVERIALAPRHPGRDLRGRAPLEGGAPCARRRLRGGEAGGLLLRAAGQVLALRSRRQPLGGLHCARGSRGRLARESGCLLPFLAI